MNYRDTFEFWLNDDYFDQKTKEELLKLSLAMRKARLAEEPKRKAEASSSKASPQSR